MRGASPEEVAARVLGCPGLQGLQGPTVSSVFARTGGEPCFAATICVPKSRLYASVKELRSVRSLLLVARPVDTKGREGSVTL